MQVLNKYKSMKAIPYKRIGNIIPEGNVTLAVGLPSTGKSFSTLKFLNENGIEPFVFNMDSDPTLANTFKYIGMTDEKSVLRAFINDEIEDLDNQVIVIDTYTRLVDALGISNTEPEQKQISDQLESLCKKHNYTIIVIGHTEDYASKSNIFKDNQVIARNCAEYLNFDKNMGTGKNSQNISYRLVISKGRGIGGTKVIENWMR